MGAYRGFWATLDWFSINLKNNYTLPQTLLQSTRKLNITGVDYFNKSLTVHDYWGIF